MKNKYDIEDVLDFGKFSGSTILEVLDKCPTYIEWAIDQKIIKLTSEALETALLCINDFYETSPSEEAKTYALYMGLYDTEG